MDDIINYIDSAYQEHVEKPKRSSVIITQSEFKDYENEIIRKGKNDPKKLCTNVP